MKKPKEETTAHPVYSPILGKGVKSMINAEEPYEDEDTMGSSDVNEDESSLDSEEDSLVSTTEVEHYKEERSIQILSPQRDLLWPEFSIENAKTKNAFGYFIVPIVTVGVWDHPHYGEVNFEQPTIDEMIANFNNNVCCYDPALYIGHGSMLDGGGRAAAGFLEVLVQSADVLWGIFAAVDEDAYLAVKKGLYRYSSAEISTNYLHSQTMQEYGTTITGCALTNEPFLTNMPPVKAFSQIRTQLQTETSSKKSCTSRPLAFSSRLDHNKCVKDNVLQTLSVAENPPSNLTNMTDRPTPVADLSASPALQTAPAGVASIDLALSSTITALGFELKELKLSVATFTEQMAQLQTENKVLKAARQQDIRDRRFAIVQQATLSAAAKQAFTTALGSPTLDDATADAIIAQVKNLSSEEETTYLTQQGQSEVPAAAAPAPVVALSNVTSKAEFAYQSYLEERAARLNAQVK